MVRSARPRRSALGELELESAGKWIYQIFVGVLRVFGVIHPLVAAPGAGIALHGGDQVPAAGMDREVDGFDRPTSSRASTRSSPSTFLPAGHDSSPFRPLHAGPLILAADRRADGRPGIARRVHRHPLPAQADPAELRRSTRGSPAALVSAESPSAK